VLRNNFILGGPEPINWAYVTKSGVSQAPADPLFTGTFDNPNFAAVNLDFNRDLMMKPGDRIRSDPRSGVAPERRHSTGDRECS